MRQAKRHRKIRCSREKEGGPAGNTPGLRPARKRDWEGNPSLSTPTVAQLAHGYCCNMPAARWASASADAIADLAARLVERPELPGDGCWVDAIAAGVERGAL